MNVDCGACYCSGRCRIRRYAIGTAPWAEKALASAKNLESEVRRVLRGNKDSPGFVEDARTDGCLTDEEISFIVQGVLSGKGIVLRDTCRNYLGPKSRGEG